MKKNHDNLIGSLVAAVVLAGGVILAILLFG